LVVEHYYLAGTLRLYFPESRIYTVRKSLVIPAPERRESLLIWDANLSGEAPSALLEYAARHLFVEVAEIESSKRYVETPYAGVTGGSFKLGLLPVRPAGSP